MSFRLQSERDIVQQSNGSWSFVGVLVSTGAAVNNSTTATPFANVPRGPLLAPPAVTVPANYDGTLAGRFFCVQPSASGFILPGSSAAITITSQTLPTGNGLIPGLQFQAGERVEFILKWNEGWLQWLPTTGSANLFVYELL